MTATSRASRRTCTRDRFTRVVRAASRRAVSTSPPVPRSAAECPGCASVTRIAGSPGTNLATDYRCYTGLPDAYNYQPFNLIMTPQERGSIFANYEYEINEAMQLYAEVLYSRTTSGFQIAPLPFDALADDVVISGQSYYNPFDYDFGGATTGNPNLTVRMEALGNRSAATRPPTRRWPSWACAAACSVPNGTTTSWSAIAASTRRPRSPATCTSPLSPVRSVRRSIPAAA